MKKLLVATRGRVTYGVSSAQWSQDVIEIGADSFAGSRVVYVGRTRCWVAGVSHKLITDLERRTDDDKRNKSSSRSCQRTVIESRVLIRQSHAMINCSQSAQKIALC